MSSPAIQAEMTGGFQFYTWTGPLNRPKPIADVFHRLGATNNQTYGGGAFAPVGGTSGQNRMPRSGVQVVDYRAETSRCQAHMFFERFYDADNAVRGLYNTIGTKQTLRINGLDANVDVLVIDIVADAPRAGSGCCSVLQTVTLVLEALN
jgi:hypothetical protein